MKRIYIDKNIEELAEDYAKNLFAKRQARPLQNLQNLENALRTIDNLQNNILYADYVKAIQDNYTEILKVQPQEFDNKKGLLFNQNVNVNLNERINYDNNNQEFYKHIVDAMKYKDARDEFLPYVKKIGIKTCVYCNTQLAVTAEETNGNFRGMYELDHFKPKSEYPFLCTSFFNLQPCCAYCNKSKSTRTSKFGLYTTDDQEINPFNFSITQKSLLKYMLSQDCNDLEIIFDSQKAALKTNHENLFHISALYETQKDVIEEIIWKSKIYNKSYEQSIKEAFGNKFDKINFNRFILGNYDKSEDIHKRPMAKLVQDIARQLKII